MITSSDAHPVASPSPPPRRRRSRSPLRSCSSTKSRQLQRSCSPRSQTSSLGRQSRSRSWSPLRSCSSTKSRQWQRSCSPRSQSPSLGRRWRSRSWSPVSSVMPPPAASPPPPPPPLKEKALDTLLEKKALYLFFHYPFGPMVSSLYAIDIPHPSPHPPPNYCKKGMKYPKTILPVLEFGLGQYPRSMCCVELNSKLYFLGGEFEPKEGEKDFFDPFSPNVYIIDTSTITTTTTSAVELLTAGPPMESGKPQCYAFVADEKIYTISGYIGFGTKKHISRFEMFDPVSSQWKSLPDPPMNVSIRGHAVVETKVFLATWLGDNHDIYVFDLDGGWLTKIAGVYSKFHRKFWGRAEFVEGRIYSIYYSTVAEFGPSSSSKQDLLGLFDQMSLLHPDMDAIAHHLPAINRTNQLAHMGNTTFCHVVAGNPLDPNHDEVPDSERGNISITIFEALRDDPYCPKTSSGGRSSLFWANYLYCADFVARTRCSANADHFFLDGCFFLSSSAPKIARLDDEQRCSCNKTTVLL